MSTSNEILTAAMDVVLTWGPERARPEIDRLRDRFPALDEPTALMALARASEVLSEATALARDVKGGRMDYPQAERKLQENRPWLTADQASNARNQGLYYDWRETGE